MTAPVLPQPGTTDAAAAAEAGPTNAPAVPADLLEQPCWYAVWTRARHEKVVTEQLRRKAFEVFLPTYETVRQWKNGRHRVVLPLFAGYTFVRIPLRQRLEVLRVGGVVALVGANGRPIPLEEEEIASLQRALASGVPAAPHPFLTVGRRVRITAGPLVGWEGILLRRKATARVVLSIELIHRSLRVELDPQWLEPVTESRSARCQPATHSLADRQS